MKKASNRETSLSSESEENDLRFLISDQEFDLFRKLIYDLAGINLSDNKKMLVISRLSRRLRTLNLQSFGEYLDYLRSAPEAEKEMVEMINRITTNKTDFFREIHHFEFLSETLIPSLLKAGKKDIRVWSAGCSTGEEPYTIAMVIDAACRKTGFKPNQIDLRILATDIDTDVIDHARKAEYSKATIQQVPVFYRERYFEHATKDTFRVRDDLKYFVSIKRFNLTHEFPFRKGFDVIFCRNVLIYFNQTDRLTIVRKMKNCLRDKGILILGHSESLLAEKLGFENLGDTMYLKA